MEREWSRPLHTYTVSDWFFCSSCLRRTFNMFEQIFLLAARYETMTMETATRFKLFVGSSFALQRYMQKPCRANVVMLWGSAWGVRTPQPLQIFARAFLFSFSIAMRRGPRRNLLAFLETGLGRLFIIQRNIKCTQYTCAHKHAPS